jgi:hypothetical protein
MISNKWSLSLFLCAILFCIFPAAVLSDVIVYDIVALKGKEAMLMAETRGGFLSKGGELVEFIVNEKSIGKNLSGRDGFAVKGFVPVKTGLYKIHVRSGDDKDSGVLLALEKKTNIVFIDVEGSLLEGSFVPKAKFGSAKAVKKIYKRFSIVFLQKGFMGVKAIKSWLKKNDFPEAPVLLWSRGEVFGEMKEKGLKIKAVVGGPEVIESAEMYKPRAFSFDSMEDAEVVEDWGEIEKNLK